jgi:hypothetical protein
MFGGNAIGDPFPMPAIIGGLKQVWPEVITLVGSRCKIQTTGYKRMRLDRIDLDFFR